MDAKAREQVENGETLEQYRKRFAGLDGLGQVADVLAEMREIQEAREQGVRLPSRNELQEKLSHAEKLIGEITLQFRYEIAVSTMFWKRQVEHQKAKVADLEKRIAGITIPRSQPETGEA